MAKNPRMSSLLRVLRKQGGARQTTARELGGKLEPGGAPYWKEHVAYEDAQGNPHVIDLILTGTCSFGHTVDDKVRVAGICELGREVLCSEEGCMLQCRHCGSVVCRLHGRTFGKHTYCRRHVWVHYWRRFWALE